MNSQKEFWENEQVQKRRHPSHPVIESFANPKVKKITEIIKRKLDMSDTKEKTLLDVGSGNGYFSYYFDRAFDVTCLDFSNSILSVNPNLKKIQASAFQLPFRDNSFDVVFCANLLHHIDNPLRVIDEMGRVSSRFITIVEPNRNNPFMMLIALVSKEDRLVINYSHHYLRSLIAGKFRVIWQSSFGFILPNKTPVSLLPLCKIIEPFMMPKLYNVLVAEKNEIH